jgi:hypothetical protein
MRGRGYPIGPGRSGTRKGHEKGIRERGRRSRSGPARRSNRAFGGDWNSLRSFPREAFTDLNSALPPCSACCTPAPPNLHAWVSLPPPLPPLYPVDQPGQAGSETARPDPSQPARSDPSRDPSPKSRSESAGLIRVIRCDLSRPARPESARTDPSLCPLQLGLLILPYIPAMTATGHRSTTSRGSEAASHR